ncbi:hypothetical protein Tco_1152318 [Tanacetum coccineum]
MIIKSSSNIIECTVTKLVEFINTHQLVLLVFALIDEAYGIGICCIGIPAFEIRSIRIWLCDVELLLLVIISTNGDPIQMFVAVPFDNLKLCDNNDSTFGVDIMSDFPVSSKSIELLTLASLMRDSP